MTVAGRHAEESFGRIAVVVLLHGIKPRLSVFSVIWLNRAKIAAALEAGEGSQRPDINPVTLSIEAKLRRAGKGKRLVIANGAGTEVKQASSN